MTIEQARENIDAIMAKARTSSLAIIEESEKRFIESVTARGAMTEQQALAVLDEHRPVVLDDLDEQMNKLRAWILRGCTDLH